MGVRQTIAAVVCGAAALGVAVPAASAAITIGIGTPTVTLSPFGPGRTATGTGGITITAVATSWTLSVADSSGNAGKLAPAAAGCTGAESLTSNPLTVSVSGLLGTTHSNGSVTVGAAGKTVATGTGTDTLTASYSLVVGQLERMPTGCLFSTTLTYTAQ